MRRVPGFVPFITCFLFSSSLLCSASSGAQQGTPIPPPNTGNNQARSFSVNGTVTDALTHAQLDLVKIELHPFGGGVAGTAFTSGSGSFQLDNIADGNYTLVADRVGYQILNIQVEVRGMPVYWIQIELVRIPDSGAVANNGTGTISQRELSIPRKAHDDMEKGMALLYGKSDYQGSLKPFEKAIQEFPDYYEAYSQIGVAYMKLADAGSSEKAFRKSIEVSHGRYAGAYIGLADLFMNGGRFADAELFSRKAVEIDSNSWPAKSQLARVLLALHRSSEAETCAIAAVALKPDNADLYLVLANAHIQLGNRRALLDDLDHYLELAPSGSFAEQARRMHDNARNDLAASQKSPTTSGTTLPPLPDSDDQ